MNDTEVIIPAALGLREGQPQFGTHQQGTQAKRLDIEKKIEEMLATEKDVTALYNALFSQHGLFHQLAPTIESRRSQRESPLYRRAKSVVNGMMLAAEAELRSRLSQQS